MNRRWTALALTLLLILGAATLTQCELTPYQALLWLLTGISPQQVGEEPPERHALDVTTPATGGFRFQASTPNGPPYPAKIQVIWTAPPGASNINRDPVSDSHCFEHNGSISCNFSLSVNPYTGQTQIVTVTYDPPPGATKVTDTFYYGSETYGHNTQAVTRPVSGGGTQPVSPPPARQPAPPPAAHADTYYRWLVHMRFQPARQQTMTGALCQDAMTLLQNDDTFLALRFPVYPPTAVYTTPYTLPVAVDADAPQLLLRDETAWPPTPVLTVPLEYKARYHTFLENELPAAPGEHWLALGLVTSPTMDCAGLAGLADWSFQADLWLDWGGAQDAGLGDTLLGYYCYEGQDPPTIMPLVPRAESVSYQGWGITCFGPQPLHLESYVRPLDIYDTHTGWVTPTQTIAFSHTVMNWSLAPLTVAATYSSTLGLPWGVYSGTESAPDDPPVPIVEPFPLGAFYPHQQRTVWLIATVPEDTPWGVETLIITATDVTSPAQSAWTSDLLWVGDWVAPPPPPAGQHRVYLPIVVRP